MNAIVQLSVVIISSLITVLVQNYFLKKNKVDEVNKRSSHTSIATRTGGVSIFLSLFIFSLFYYSQDIQPFDFSLIIPTGIMFLVGVYDDFYKADFRLKFFMQIIVAKLLIDQGFVIDNYHGLFGLYEVPWLLAQATTVFVFVVIVNAINFIDGIDGLALTECLKVFVIFELLIWNESPFTILTQILVLSGIPLYYFNFKKTNKVFLGDAGSLFLGTCVCVYIFNILGTNYSLNPSFQSNKVIFTVLLIFYPLIDLLRVFIIRIQKGTSPFLPDKNHIHHWILLKTNNHKTVLLVIQAFSLLWFFSVILIFNRI